MSLEEIASAQGPLESALTAGLESISQQQVVEFTQYNLLILPIDGYVFWVNAGKTILVKGSIHIAADSQQNVDESIGINHVIFTSEEEIDDFNAISPTTIFIGTFNGLQFSFNNQKNFYRQASIWHYRGNAVYPAMATQLLQSASGFNEDDAVVSNSLPLWLALNDKCPMYPSFLVSPNIVPPYASIHIEPSNTTAIQAAPSFTSTLSHNQLASDIVRITTYGLRNNEALDFQDYLMQHSLDTDDFGIMNMPIMRDEKRTQSELGILAQKKTIDFQVSYYQSRIADIARQLILHATVNIYLQ